MNRQTCRNSESPLCRAYMRDAQRRSARRVKRAFQDAASLCPITDAYQLQAAINTARAVTEARSLADRLAAVTERRPS